MNYYTEYETLRRQNQIAKKIYAESLYSLGDNKHFSYPDIKFYPKKQKSVILLIYDAYILVSTCCINCAFEKSVTKSIKN